MTKEERGQIVWHILIQWLASRNELDEWIEDILGAIDIGRMKRYGEELVPDFDAYLTDLNPFTYIPTSGDNYIKWCEEWEGISKKLLHEMPVVSSNPPF